MKFGLIVFCLALLFASCTFYKDVEVTEVLDVKILTFDAQSAEAEIFLSITNPNPYKITLTESHINVLFEGKPLGEVDLKEKVVIPAKSVSTVTMTCVAGYDSLKALMGNVLSLLFQDTYSMEGEGYIKGRVLLISKKVPVKFQEKLSKADLGF